MLRKEPAEREGQKDEQPATQAKWVRVEGRMPSPGGRGKKHLAGQRWRPQRMGLRPELASLRNAGRRPCCWFSRQAEHEFGVQQSGVACN